MWIGGARWSRKQAKMLARGLEPKLNRYIATLNACEQRQQPERPLELLAEMPARGLEPIVIIYNVARSACEKGSQP